MAEEDAWAELPDLGKEPLPTNDADKGTRMNHCENCGNTSTYRITPPHSFDLVIYCANCGYTTDETETIVLREELIEVGAWSE